MWGAAADHSEVAPDAPSPRFNPLSTEIPNQGAPAVGSNNVDAARSRVDLVTEMSRAKAGEQIIQRSHSSFPRRDLSATVVALQDDCVGLR